MRIFVLIISTFLNFSPSFQFLRPTIPIRALAYRTAMTSYGSSMELAFDLFWKSKRFSTVTNYWRMLMGCRNLPPYINGDEEFGVTNLLELHEAGMRGEFTSKDSRYTSRKTYALRVGYDGTAYSGFQSQRNWDILTVEDDLKKITGKRVVAAGRTDRNVSALSQVVCYTVDDDLIEAELLEKVKSSEAFRQQRLTVYDVRRVPRSFNSRSCATWRRYLYLLPLDPGIYTMGYDVDVGFVNDCLNRLQHESLPYNAFAYKEDRTSGEGLQDLCTLYRARAYVVDLGESIIFPATERLSSAPASKELISAIPEETIIPSSITPTSASAYSPVESELKNPAMCVELVGTRFLRQMVRKLVSTSVRESLLPIEVRNVNILRTVCESGDRTLSAPAFPGEGLCFAGVGYDTRALSFYKFMPKQQVQAVRELLGMPAEAVTPNDCHHEGKPKKSKLKHVDSHGGGDVNAHTDVDVDGYTDSNAHPHADGNDDNDAHSCEGDDNRVTHDKVAHGGGVKPLSHDEVN